jgi:hypothetical protein
MNKLIYGTCEYSFLLARACNSRYITEGIERRVFENRVLRRIFGPKTDEVIEWRKLHKRNFVICTPRQIPQ